MYPYTINTYSSTREGDFPSHETRLSGGREVLSLRHARHIVSEKRERIHVLRAHSRAELTIDRALEIVLCVCVWMWQCVYV